MKTRMMKPSLHLIIYITFLLLLSACENEIPYDTAQKEPQLIMNALINAGRTDNLVYLHLSEGTGVGRVSEGTLSLYVNGQLKETPEALSPSESIGGLENNYPEEMKEQILQSIKFKVFRLTTILHPGDNVRLESTAENGKYHVSAEVTVPQPVDKIQVDTCLAYVKEYNGLKPYRQFKVTLKDRSNEKNYYRLNIVNDFSFRCQPINDTFPDVIITKQYTDLINRDDVILTDGHPTNSDDENNELFPNIKNKYNIFTDNRFSNSNVTLKVYTQRYENILPDEIFNQIYRTGSISIQILSITEAEYRYLKALNCLNSDDYDDILMEPISIPSNVKGGLGFVGICSESTTTIQFPETTIYHRYTE